MGKWPPRKPPPKGPNDGHWRAGRKWPWWKDENRVWNKRRSGGLRQKPWNKVRRIEKFWVPEYRIRGANQNIAFSTTGAPGYAVFWDPFVENTEQTATFNFTGPGIGAVKVHRIDGYIRCWCPQTFVPSEVPPEATPWSPPWVCVDYIWKVVDKKADTHDAGSFAASELDPRMYSSGDIYELLQRDDILRWGSEVIQPSQFRLIKADVDAAAAIVGWPAAGLTFERGMVKIPFPRVGKMGLNIKRGKALALIVSGRNLVDGGSGTTIDDGLDARSQIIMMEPTFRLLCSA